MTTLLDRVSTAGRRAETRSEFRLPAVARGRRPLVAVASTALVLASVAIFASLYSSADHQVPVLVVTTTIHQGQRIIGSDLGTVDVAASGGLSVVPVADATELSGTWAASTIPAGSLINRSDVTTSRPLAVGTGVVGLALKDGQLPAGGVEPGDRVMIVVTPATGSVPVEGTTDGSDSTRARVRARVTAPSSPRPPCIRPRCQLPRRLLVPSSWSRWSCRQTWRPTWRQRLPRHR